jgi:hypothetical protein
MKRTYWHADATPIETTLDKVLYDIRRDDGTDGLIFDAVSLRDLEEAMDARLTLDAMLSPYNKLESKMSVLEQVMNRAGTAVKVTARQLSEPFTQNGTANVVALFELSDGQTVSIYFHNPDTTPKKILPTDEMISWKWLLNKKDITIVVAPEKGKDLNVRQVATRIMKLAETNSKGFQRANTKRAERMAEIDGLRTEISQLEGALKGKLSQIEALKVEVEDAKIARETAGKSEDIPQQGSQAGDAGGEKEEAESASNQPVIEITGKELGEFPDTEEGKKALRAAAIDFFNKELVGIGGVKNIDLDKVIEFNAEGRNKVKSFSADQRKLRPPT